MSQLVSYSNWIIEWDFKFLIYLLCDWCQYELSDDEYDGIVHELKKASQKDAWGDYELNGKTIVKLNFYNEVGSCVIDFKIETEAEIIEKVKVMESILHYRSLFVHRNWSMTL